jgi:para-nitrobenzyl esterase
MVFFCRPCMTIARGAALALALFALGANSAVTSAANAASSNQRRPAHGPVVATDAGQVRGVWNGATEQFLGIPYAAPPTGDLRWRPPHPAARHTGVLDATSFAPHCAQPGSVFGTASTSENCLYLNVYEPAGGSRSTKLPVMVWIHGGSLLHGESEDYGPTPLVRDGVVVVTINYRLGALGFLAHPALSAEAGGSSGDYGLMDQQAALRWVQRNIDNFGGNPRHVTIFGESAGGLSVLSQLASPRAAGLFSGAIVESGAYALTQAPQASANTSGTRFASAVGCSDQSAACLRSRPVAQLLATQNGGVAGYLPNIDGRVLTQSISTALSSGQFNRVPLINGSNADEWRLFVASYDLAGTPVTADTYQSAISAIPPGVDAATAAAIAARYPLSAYPSADLALGAVGTDAIFACNARKVDQMASKYVPTYAYEFADEHAPQRYLPPVSYPYGAYHTAEVQYLFDLPVTPQASSLNRAQHSLASTMRRYCTGFAALGAPTATGARPRWPAYSTMNERFQQLAPPKPTTATGFAAEHQCGFWSPS